VERNGSGQALALWLKIWVLDMFIAPLVPALILGCWSWMAGRRRS